MSTESWRSAKIARTPSARPTLVSDDQAAESRRENRIGVSGAQQLAERTTECFGVRRVLQHERALQVAAAVQPRRQAEVPLEQRARFAKEFEDRVLIHCLSRGLVISAGCLRTI
jgi:hypothetical protein